MPDKIVIRIGDIWHKAGETRKVLNLTGNRRNRRVWYIVKNAILDCRWDNFRRWCIKAELTGPNAPKPQP